MGTLAVYTTNAATDCHAVKEYLSQKGIEFIERNFDDDPLSMGDLLVLLQALGPEMFGDPPMLWPTIVYVDEGRPGFDKTDVVVGFDRAKIDALIAKQTGQPSNDASYYFRLCVTHAEQGDVAAAIDDLTRAIALEPTNPEYYKFRAAAYEKSDKQEQAIADWSKLIELQPATAWYYARGRLCVPDKPDLAIADLTEAIKQDPSKAGYFFYRGVAYLLKGYHNRAIADLGKAIQLSPKSADYYSMRAEAYYKMNDHARAITDSTRAIELDPKQVIHYTRRAQSYLGANDIKRALQDCDEVCNFAKIFFKN